MTEQDPEEPRELLTLEELTAQVGMSVRNVRFYTGKGLVPPPIRRGRSGFYSREHVARLELVRELQGHGFTLAAIERYLAGLPTDATPEDVALRRTMLVPWQADATTEMGRAELGRRAARDLSEDDLAMLEVLGIVRPTGTDRFRVDLAQLPVGVGLLELGFPPGAAQAAAEVYAAHGRAMADELMELFRTQVWPAYKQSGASPERLREVVERLKPLSIASLVSAYETAMDERRREIAQRSAGRRAASG